MTRRLLLHIPIQPFQTKETALPQYHLVSINNSIQSTCQCQCQYASPSHQTSNLKPNHTKPYHTIPPHSATTPPRLTSPHHPNHHHNHNTIPTYNHNTITITTPKPLPIHFLDLFIATKPPTHHSHSTPPVRPSTTTLPLLSHPIPVPRETHLACRILPSIVLSIPLLFHLGTVLRLRTL